MGKKLNYPVQMASIKKGDYRLSEYLEKSKEKLEEIENKLWTKILTMAQSAEKPSSKDSRIKGSKLIGYGWEYSVYEVNDKVVKIPRGVFPEVNYKEYLENTKFTYNVCKKFLGKLVADSDFERRNLDHGVYNLIIQDKLEPSTHRYIKTYALSTKIKKQLIVLGERMLNLLDEMDWIPDINLHETEEGDERVWSLRNVSSGADGDLKLFDFTAYYDVFRLYPKRTEDEIALKGHVWEEFLKKLKK